MFEHATLQEAYTGALIAGKGKALNNINVIMDRAKLPTADWARVRFGAGTPWRRCWCVITPPDEKEVQRLQKQLNKKKSAYDRSKPVLLKGDIKFYDSKKVKKGAKPIATINDAYSAFAIYPQSKPLIDASTLVKVEGSITIHANPPSTTEGFIFVMPEVHPAVTGFEMMLRWLFPVFDTFSLYGRPGRLVADTTDTRSLMFAMPKHRRYGYLEILDVSSLILENGSSLWKESEWRKRMKELTGKRMTAIEAGGRSDSRYSGRKSARNSFGPSQSRIRFDDGASVRSQPSISWGQGAARAEQFDGVLRTDSAPPGIEAFATPPKALGQSHLRSVSETQGLDRYANQNTLQYDGNYEKPPTPPPHNTNLRYANELGSTPERLSSEDEQPSRANPVRELQELQTVTSPEPVAAPPAFSHAPGAMPATKPYHSPESRRAKSRMSTATLSQLAGAAGAAGHLANVSGNSPRTSEDRRGPNASQVSAEIGQKVVQSDANKLEPRANYEDPRLGAGTVTPRFSFDRSNPSRLPNYDTQTNTSQASPHSPSNAARNVPIESPLFSHSPQAQSTNSTKYELPQVSTTGLSRQSQQSLSTHTPQSSAGSINTGSQPNRVQTTKNVVRKPLPMQSSSMVTLTAAETVTSSSNLGPHVTDQATFEKMRYNSTNNSAQREADRHNSGFSSIYKDANSTGSPDYASTRRSVDTRVSMEKPRAGVMKTVGNVEMGDARYANPIPDSNIHIDFGPTLNYAALRSNSPGTSQPYGRGTSPAGGPAMNNYPADRQPRTSSFKGRDSSGLSKSPQRKALTPENVDYPESRTMPWQPIMAVARQGPQQSITPEQFVQQRAAPTPLYSHQRQQSSNDIRANAPTSSPKLHSRNTSTELLQRPHSRGASVTLGPSGSGDIASHLSAREQEHLSKVTGQPLINLARSSNQYLSPAGLIGAIDQREKDKQQMKQGINSQAVQQAIAQRQQLGHYQQYPDQISPDYRGSSQTQPNVGQQQLRSVSQAPRTQSYGVNATASAFVQGGGWATPTPILSSNEQPYQPPVQQYAPAGQNRGYFPPQQQPGQGNGSQGFHGHGP